MRDLSEKELAEYARLTIYAVADVRRIITQASLVPGLQESIRAHEEDCACLPEDRSVTETVKALQTRVAELEALLWRFVEGEYVANSTFCDVEDFGILSEDIEKALQNSSPLPAAMVELGEAYWAWRRTNLDEAARERFQAAFDRVRELKETANGK